MPDEKSHRRHWTAVELTDAVLDQMALEAEEGSGSPGCGGDRDGL
jgi:hypothetical protein